MIELNIIPTKKLSLNDIPKIGSKWSAISKFALTFDVKEGESKFKNLNDELELLSITELRYLLYIEQRRYNHFGREPESALIKKCYTILDLIRNKLNHNEDNK